MVKANHRQSFASFTHLMKQGTEVEIQNQTAVLTSKDLAVKVGRLFNASIICVFN